MSAKYSFELKSEDRRRDLPHKLLLVQHPEETRELLLLKLLAYLLFFRDRILVEPHFDPDVVAFVPAVAATDFGGHARLWVECGLCPVTRLDKLAVKVPEAEIWIVLRSPEEVSMLIRAMSRAELRRDRYRLLTFDPAVFDEMAGLLTQRNHVVWVGGSAESGQMQLDFNGLWFDAELTVTHF
jgi:hypothetical protein